MQRVKARAPSSFKAQVNDTERRLNILFDHLNNEDLLKPATIDSMVELARAIQSREYEAAQAIHLDILTNRTDECGNWMVCHLPPNIKQLTQSNFYLGRCQTIDWHEQSNAMNGMKKSLTFSSLLTQLAFNTFLQHRIFKCRYEDDRTWPFSLLELILRLFRFLWLK